MCPVEKPGIFSGKLVFEVVLTVKIALILTIVFRIQAETSHFLGKPSTSFHSCMKKLGMSWCLCHKGARQCPEFWEREAPGRLAGVSQRIPRLLWQSQAGWALEGRMLSRGVPAQLLQLPAGLGEAGCPFWGQPGLFLQENPRQGRGHDCKLNITICEQKRGSGRFQSHGGVIARGCHSSPGVPRQWRGCEWVLGSPQPSLLSSHTGDSMWVVNSGRLCQVWLVILSQTCLELDSPVGSAKSD